MTISYPINIPTTSVPAEVEFIPVSVVGMGQSPLTLAQKIYAHQGAMWQIDVSLPPMLRADAESWVAFLLKLNGMEGTFLMGDPVNTTPRGTWSGGAPLARGSQSGRTFRVYNLAPFATIKEGDWFQLGSAGTACLYKVTNDATADSNGEATLDIWPRIRTAPSAGDNVTIANTVGRWRLSSNEQRWKIREAQIYGISFSAIEDLTA